MVLRQQCKKAGQVRATSAWERRQGCCHCTSLKALRFSPRALQCRRQSCHPTVSLSHLPLITKWHGSAGAQRTNETNKGRAMWTINSLLPIWTQILWCTDVPFFNIVITLRQRTCWLTTKHVSFFWWCLNTFLLAKDLHLHCRLLVKLLWSHLSKANGSRVFLSTTKKKGNTFK